MRISGGGIKTMSALEAAEADQLNHLKMRDAWLSLGADSPHTLAATVGAREHNAAVERQQVCTALALQ